MATRQNKKRKGGRPNAPPRERTVTTLTDGPDSPFVPPPLYLDYDDPAAAALLSPPFQVSTPLSAPSPASLPAGPFPPFAVPSFPYNNFLMSPLASGPYPPPQHPPAHLFVAPQQNHGVSMSQLPPAQHLLPPSQNGQKDLEILERLKQTIKNNQHELFRPVPQPAALASVYLGPKSALVSQVPPHPEQLPSDPSPPGLSLLSHDSAAAKVAPAEPPATNVSNQTTARVPAQSPRGTAKKLPHRSSVSESPKNNAMPPPGTRPTPRFDPSINNKPDSSSATYSGNNRHDHTAPSPRMGPPGLQRLDPPSSNHQFPGKSSARSDNADSSASSGEPSPAKLSIPNGKDDLLPPRDSAWPSRDNVDNRPRNESDRSGGRSVSQSPRMANASTLGHANGNDTRDLPARDQRAYERDRDTPRERDNQREQDRDYGRDRGRPPRDEPNRFRDDRRNDDRPRPPDNRRSSPDARRYEPRYPPRRFDSKASDSSVTSPRLADKSPPGPRPPPRNLGEERAIIRPPADVAAPRPSLPDERRAPPPPPVDERTAKPPPPVDDRRPVSSLSGPDRQARPNDDRRPLPSSADRLPRPEDKRPPPPAASERAAIPVDDRRRPPSPAAGDRYGRALDDRRGPQSPPPSSVDRRPVDDRRPPPPSGDRYVPGPAGNDRRAPVSAAGDRATRPPVDNRRQPSLEERISRAPAPVLPDSVPPRPILEDRRPAQLEERNARSSIPLEERISRAPSLHERLNQPPVRQDARPVPRLEDRLSRPANAPPSLEERLSAPIVPEERPLRPRSRSRPPRPPPAASERPPLRPADDRSAPPAPPAQRPPPPRSEDRVFTPADRVPRPATPAGSDRGHPPAARASYRAPSVARDEPRTFRPASPARSPVRSDVREFRPASEPRDRLSYRSGPPPEPERYQAERRPAPVPAPAPTPAPEPMDVEPVHPRPMESRLSYRRPSPPPAEYPARDRAWVPAGEAYREPEPARRIAADPAPLSYSREREWREGERPYADDYADRSWDRERGREYDRDARFVERDAVPPAWETREERERRAAYPPEVPPPPPPPARAYERPLSARLTDVHVDDRDRAYLDRGRYAVEPPPPAPAYSRVRPRSPSPVRRGGVSDDMRAPPPKRVRDDAYYYPDERPAEYLPPPPPPPPRMRTPPPVSGVYYDDPRYPASPGRDREYLERERDVGYAAYDRRVDAGARMPPRRSPPPYAYARDDRRY